MRIKYCTVIYVQTFMHRLFRFIMADKASYVYNEARRIYPDLAKHVRRTPLEASSFLGENVYLKLESEQITGSFKLRGACNKIFKIINDDPKAKEKGFTTASSGNHAKGCCMALKKIGAKGIIYVASTALKSKVDALKSYGVEVRLHGDDCMEAEVQARTDAQKLGMIYISPYNDIDVICGQATIGLEIYDTLPEVDAVFVPVGGGGLIAGIAAYLKQAKPSIKIIGCQPAASCVMSESIKAGKIIDIPSYDTLSDATAGGIEEGAVTFDFCRSLVDEWVMVSEKEISDAVYLILEKHHKLIEGAAGVSVASFLKTAQAYEGKNVVIISCGANIGMDQLKKIINDHT
ncbi:putative threonine dehydratase [Amphiura filiformis]|uniref:putative threonine dehydratase n=1 Tax=Amphiura filiformis TaxID=82378 RepID=UPI003B20CCB6